MTADKATVIKNTYKTETKSWKHMCIRNPPEESRMFHLQAYQQKLLKKWSIWTITVMFSIVNAIKSMWMNVFQMIFDLFMIQKDIILWMRTKNSKGRRK